jgi:hypothetical protein
MYSIASHTTDRPTLTVAVPRAADINASRSHERFVPGADINMGVVDIDMECDVGSEAFGTGVQA